MDKTPATDAELFEQHRGLLFTVAYEMLGSVADAEDVVQDTWVRWSAGDRDDVVDARAYLVRIATRLALNRLRTLRTRRETYFGPWLPEPVVTGDSLRSGTAPVDVAAEVERAEDVSMAMLVVLETLSPLERAVFVLREVFGMTYPEIAQVLERSQPSVRQLAHRAREHVRDRQPRFSTDLGEQRAVTERFLQACLTGDMDELLTVLAPDVRFISDSGGKMKAAVRPIVGADKVARFLVGVLARDAPSVVFEPTELNGTNGIVSWIGDDFYGASIAELVDGKISRILMFRNPERIAGLTWARSS